MTEQFQTTAEERRLRELLAQAGDERDAFYGKLERIKAFVSDEARMVQWGMWRSYIASDGKASWPRDAFESVLAWIEDEATVNAE